MGQIPTSLLASVPHLVFGIFNLALPNVVVWAGIVLVLGMVSWHCSSCLSFPFCVICRSVWVFTKSSGGIGMHEELSLLQKGVEEGAPKGLILKVTPIPIGPYEAKDVYRRQRTIDYGGIF